MRIRTENFALIWGFKNVREANAYLRKENRKYGKAFVELERSAWPKALQKTSAISAYRNHDFLATIYNESEKVPGLLRITVNRTLLGKDGAWAEDIAWEELQGIKDELGFADRDAVEVYPRKRCIVDVASLRHIWILPEPLEWIWGH